MHGGGWRVSCTRCKTADAPRSIDGRDYCDKCAGLCLARAAGADHARRLAGRVKRRPMPPLPTCCQCRKAPARSHLEVPPLCVGCASIRARDARTWRVIAARLARSKLEAASVDLFAWAFLAIQAGAMLPGGGA